MFAHFLWLNFDLPLEVNVAELLGRWKRVCFFHCSFLFGWHDHQAVGLPRVWVYQDNVWWVTWRPTCSTSAHLCEQHSHRCAQVLQLLFLFLLVSDFFFLTKKRLFIVYLSHHLLLVYLGLVPLHSFFIRTVALGDSFKAYEFAHKYVGGLCLHDC